MVDPDLRAIYEPKAAALEYAELGLNLYGNCSHRCRYCYNRERSRGLRYDRPTKKASVENIRHDLELLHRRNDKRHVHISFMGDPYDRGRTDNSYTREVLELFRKWDQPFQLLSKGGTRAIRDFDLYGPDDRYGATLTLSDAEESKRWEPGAALPGDRIEALRQAHERGIRTWVSLEPIIDPAQTVELIELTHEFVDSYAVGRVNDDYRYLVEDSSWNWVEIIEYIEGALKRSGKPYLFKKSIRRAVT